MIPQKCDTGKFLNAAQLPLEFSTILQPMKLSNEWHITVDVSSSGPIPKFQNSELNSEYLEGGCEGEDVSECEGEDV